MSKTKSILENIINWMFILICVIGVTFTLIYIFYTSTALLTSDSVITDVLSHQQLINKQFFLTNWYYGNEFWFFSLSIPTSLLSIIIKNNILLRQVSVFITALIFFFLLYHYGKIFLNKKSTLILILIFLTGISYSILDYFYAFNAYLTVCINSLLLLLLYYNCISQKENRKLYFLLSIIFTFLLNCTSLRYFPSVTFPFVVTELILILVANKKLKLVKILNKENKTVLKLMIILIVAFLGLIVFILLANIYSYEQRAGAFFAEKISIKKLNKDVGAVIDSIHSFFGYDNKNNAITFLTGDQYFVKNKRNYPIISFFSFTNIIKMAMCVVCMIVSPIILLKNYKKNDSKLNFLLIFNIISFITMLTLYIYSNNFFYNRSELKYYIFNMILFIITSLYFLYNYVSKNKILNYTIDLFMITYMISNLYTTFLTIRDNDKKVPEKKYELVNLLKKNNLDYGYGGYWNSIISYYLSNYTITVAPVKNFDDTISPDRWYSDKRWYSNNKKHRGRVFLILDEKALIYRGNIINLYGVPDQILKCSGYNVLVYNKNPFIDKFFDDVNIS